MKNKLFTFLIGSFLLVSCNEAKVDNFEETSTEKSEGSINSDSVKQLEQSRGSLKDGKIPTH